MTPSAASTNKDDRSLGELLAELTHEIVTLVRQELTLAKAEMTQKAAYAGRQVGLLALGGALAYAGLLAIVAALVILLDLAGLPLWLAALLVGVVVAAAGGLLARKGLTALKNQDLTPQQTRETLQALKEEIR